MGPHCILASDVICHRAGLTDEVFEYVARHTLGRYYGANATSRGRR